MFQNEHNLQVEIPDQTSGILATKALTKQGPWLVGPFHFICELIKTGSLFIQCYVAFISRDLKKSHYFISLTKEPREGLNIWVLFRHSSSGAVTQQMW